MGSYYRDRAVDYDNPQSFSAQIPCLAFGSASAPAQSPAPFGQVWSQYPGAVDVWVRNWAHVEQLFNYGSAVRKVMYTTNAIGEVNSSFRKVTAFPSEDAVLKALYPA